MCPHDCPDACALVLHVEDGRVVRVDGDPEHPVTRGFVCRKVRRYAERLAAPERVLHPMRRAGAKGEGRFERITWDEALDAIVTRFQEIARTRGAEAILPCFGSGTTGLIQMYYGGLTFFDRLGASFYDRTICSDGGRAGWARTVGASFGADPEGCAASRLVVLWGANPAATNLHFVPIVQQARRTGAKVVLVDPHRTPSARLADRHLQINPGTDALLALAMMRVILEEGREDRAWIERHTTGFAELRERALGCSLADAARTTGVPADDIAWLARLYATTKPAMIRIGIGLQHHTNGGMTVRTLACLPALVGAWGVPGGGAIYNNAGAFPVSKDTLLGAVLARSTRRRVNCNELALALTALEPPVAALYVYNGNPVLSLPDRERILAGLAREDLFTVVHEQMLTDTARWADVVLPATTQLEHFDLHISYWHYHLAVNRPVLPPEGECKSSYEVFQLLAERLGIADDALRASPEAIALGMLRTQHPYLEGIDAERLVREGGSFRLRTPEIPFVPFADGRFPTPSGKVELFSAAMAREGLDPLPGYVPPLESRDGSPALAQRYPLSFLTPSAEQFLNSSFANLPAAMAREGAGPQLEIHPADAASRRIRSGDLVRVRNDRGACMLRAEVSDGVPLGTVLSTTMWWRAQSPGGTTPNATTCARTADMGRGSAFNTNLVEVERVEGGRE